MQKQNSKKREHASTAAAEGRSIQKKNALSMNDQSVLGAYQRKLADTISASQCDQIPSTAQRHKDEEEEKPNAQMKRDDEEENHVQLKSDEDEEKRSTQLKADGELTQLKDDEDEETSQLKSTPNRPVVQQKMGDNGGLPNPLRSGIESLSGMDMSDVNVHRNSDKPAQLNALAYAQGNNIHLASGQEKHLPHEAWHVVQQRQGRVPVTTQMAGTPVNDNPALEREADIMGARALQMKSPFNSQIMQQQTSNEAVLQGCFSFSLPVTQMEKRTVPGAGRSKHTLWGDAHLNLDDGDIDQHPIIMEVMEYQLGSARGKINQIGETKKGDEGDYRSIMIAYNGKALERDYNAGKDDEGDFKHSATLASYNAINTNSGVLQNDLQTAGLNGGVIPMVWSPSDPSGEDVYSQFPFLEMRARIPAHAGTAVLHDHVKDKAGDKDVIGRSMDADVSEDPLLANTLSDKSKKALFEPLLEGTADVSSGGYNWKLSHDNSPAIWGLRLHEAGELSECNFKLSKCMEAINLSEHVVRLKINRLASQAVYWPEPNTYMMHSVRKQTAPSVANDANKPKFKKSQQREAVSFLQQTTARGAYRMPAATTKPLKNYFDNNLISVIKESLAGAIPGGKVKTDVIDNIRQSHLRPDKSSDNFKWHTGQDISIELFGKIKQAIAPERASLVERLSRILNSHYASEGKQQAAEIFIQLFETIHKLEVSLSEDKSTPLETLSTILDDHYLFANPVMLSVRLDRWCDKNINKPEFKSLKRGLEAVLHEVR